MKREFSDIELSAVSLKEAIKLDRTGGTLNSEYYYTILAEFFVGNTRYL